METIENENSHNFYGQKTKKPHTKLDGGKTQFKMCYYRRVLSW